MSALSSSSDSPISKELLEELTGCEILNYFVEDGSKPGDNYMSRIYAVKVDLLIHKTEHDKEPVNETRHFLFKCFPLHPSRQGYLFKTNVFYNELSFYRVWVKALRDFQTDVVGLPENELVVPAFPPFVGGQAIDFSKLEDYDQANNNYTPLDNFIVMTNLKEEGFQMAPKSGGLDLDHLILILTELSKEHALSWAYKNKVESDVTKKFPFLEATIDDKDMETWTNVGHSRIDTAIKAMDTVLGEGNPLSKSTKDYGGKLSQVMKFFLEQSETAEMEAWKMHRSPPHDLVEETKNEEPWRLQLHGDTWSNNFLFKYNKLGKPERVILLDFQITRQGCPTADLSYLIYTSTTSKFRKSHLDSLLQLYCDKFTEYCDRLKVPVLPGLSLASLKRRFHRAKISGYILALMLFPMLYMESGSEMNLEETGEDTGLEEMFTNGYEKQALESPLYQERIIDVAQELYDEGVI